MEDVLEYRYKPHPGKMLGAMAFFAACAASMGYVALTNDRGLILNGIFTFSVEGATIFYWVVAAVSLIFVLGALFALIAGLINPMSVRLTPTEFSMPRHGLTKKTTVLQLSGITGVDIQTIQKQRFINIYYPAGKLSVAESMLPGKEAFETLHTSLLAGLRRGEGNK